MSPKLGASSISLDDPFTQEVIFLGDSDLFDGLISINKSNPDPCPPPTPCPDSDGDGWCDAAEVFIGTDPLDDCADDSSDNAHPADFNNDTFFTSADLSEVASVIGLAVPPAPARRDVNPRNQPDEAINSGDLSQIAAIIGQSCAP